ncbi:hypothetical protein GCM10027572_20730 [Flexivirga lutea]
MTSVGFALDHTHMDRLGAVAAEADPAAITVPAAMAHQARSRVMTRRKRPPNKVGRDMAEQLLKQWFLGYCSSEGPLFQVLPGPDSRNDQDPDALSSGCPASGAPG